MKEDVPMRLGRAVPRRGCVAFARPETLFANPLFLSTLLTEQREDVSTMSKPAYLSRPMPPRLRIALDAIRHGRAVILLDDDDRENEGDLIVAAERITVPMMATMIRECSGIVCLCLADEQLRKLELPPMVPRNESRFGTAFTVSIEARVGVTTGVSAADRVTTIRAAIAADAKPADLVSPGHVVPLRASAGGVMARRGHTEGAVELAVLAGLQPAAVLCELMNPDGSMMRGAELLAFSRAHGYPMLTIDELVDFRRESEPVTA
jgi:3,4-dihydroxy 2-butanone 4-phosphate synthase